MLAVLLFTDEKVSNIEMIKKFLIGLVLPIMVTFIEVPVHAMKQAELNGKVYIVTYLNASALRTSYQYMFFTSNGKAAIVPVTDVNENGQPLVTADATDAQKKAPAKIKRLLNDRQYLRKQAKGRPVQVSGKRVKISSNGMKEKPVGHLTADSRSENFTVEYSENQQKYTSVQFKQAPAMYQYK